MRAFKKETRRGFTLVELMIVVAIIGVLAALAIYGVRRYLASAKTGEAKNTIGAISRGSTAAYERETSKSETVAEGSVSADTAHTLCATATIVPAAVPVGRKYQPVTADGSDFETGDTTTGWKCLKFGLTQPIYYQYTYKKDSAVAGGNPAVCATNCYEAAAKGDLDGDGVYSYFARTGHINVASRQLKASTQVYVENEFE